MSFSALFPSYPESSSGPFHVSLSVPGPISEISKSIGVTASSSLMSPNIDYLVKFINGDLGIADDLKKSMKFKNINACKTEESFKQFAKLAKLDISDPSKFKTKNGYSVPKNLIGSDTSEDLMGIKAMEKTILKSMFETQKPYIEIAKLILGNIAKIEDVIARSMPILAPGLSNPDRLTVKSEKPKTNSGNGDKPKAIGFQSAKDLKDSLGKLQSISNKGKSIKVDKNGGVTTTPERLDPTKSEPVINDVSLGNEHYEVVSTVYSTGEFDPSVKYKYIYRDIKDDPIKIEDLTEKSDLSMEDDDPYQKLKPSKIIFGIFNSSGDIINPMTKIKSLDGNGDEVDTPFYVADWITRSPKWYFPNNISNKSGQFSWPRFGAPFYYWERYGGAQIVRSQTKPDPGDSQPDYTKKTYDDGFRQGQEVVDFNGTSEESEFISYFTDLVTKKINSTKDIEEDEKPNYINDVVSKLYVKDSEGSKQVGPYTLEKRTIDNHLDNAFKYGVLNSSQFINPNNRQSMNIPSGMKFPLKPGSVNISGKTVWIDPESDYDLKVIKVDSVIDISYEDSQGSPEVSTEILSFVKNTMSLSIDDQSQFSISIGKNSETPKIYENITEYQLDNWNYDDSDGLLGNQKPNINNTNIYSIEVWRYVENPYFVGKSSVVFDSQSANSIEMNKLNDGDWSYNEYTSSSSSETINATTPGQIVEYNIQGGPVTNGEFISKVKVFDNNRITSWFYSLSNTWNNHPPISWDVNNFKIEWQVSNSSSSGNGSLPPTKTVTSKSFVINRETEISATSSATFSYWTFDDIKLITDIRTYIPVDNGEKTLGDKSIVDVDNYKVKRWVVWKESLNGSSTINNKQVLPNYGQNNIVSLVYNTFGNNQDLDINSNIVPIPQFQIRVKDTSKYGKMIDPSKVTNEHLTHPELYSQGKYGGSPQEVGLVKRYMKTELDTETYYIVEGVLIDDVSNPNTNPPQPASGSSGSGKEWYRMPSALGATKVFLSIITDIISKLIPAIKKLLSLFKNPAKFITDIISEKLGESFSIFSAEAMSVMKKMPSIPIPHRREFIKNSILSNYVSVNIDGSYKFLLDGSGLMKLPILGNTITFGMQLAMLTPLIKLINSVDFGGYLDNTLGSFLDGKSKSPLGDLGNVDLRANQTEVNNEIVTSSGNNKNYEEISIQYSTGRFINGIDYKYIYITEYVSNLVKEADDLEATNDPDNLELAKAKMELALKEDPKNPLIRSKLDDLIKKTSNYIQPILKFLIEIVSLPIKIISGIIQWVMDFFKSLSNVADLPSKMSEFLSFSWIMDFFKPSGLLSMAGIKFDVQKLFGWVSNLNSFSLDHVFDLSEVIDISPIAVMPKVKKEQFIDMLKKPLRILYSILCLLESLINGIIDFIWSTLGIEAIIPAPHIKLCKQLNEDMSTQDIMDLLNGMFKDAGGSDGKGSGVSDRSSGDSYNFIYDIKLSNGKSLRDLNQEELRKFIEENKNISFDFLFT